MPWERPRGRSCWNDVAEGQEVLLGPPVHAPRRPARYITQQGNKLETGKSRVPPTVTNAVSWRSEGIKYKKNEVFIDVIESVNLLVSPHSSTPRLPRSGDRRGGPPPADPRAPVCIPRSMPTAVSC